MDELAPLWSYPHVVVRVECGLCPRRQGRSRLARLAAPHGPDTSLSSLSSLLDCLVSGCRYRRPGWERPGNLCVPRCHAHFPDLYGAAPGPPTALPLQRPE